MNERRRSTTSCGPLLRIVLVRKCSKENEKSREDGTLYSGRENVNSTITGSPQASYSVLPWRPVVRSLKLFRENVTSQPWEAADIGDRTRDLPLKRCQCGQCKTAHSVLTAISIRLSSRSAFRNLALVKSSKSILYPSRFASADVQRRRNDHIPASENDFIEISSRLTDLLENELD